MPPVLELDDAEGERIAKGVLTILAAHGPTESHAFAELVADELDTTRERFAEVLRVLVTRGWVRAYAPGTTASLSFWSLGPTARKALRSSVRFPPRS